MAQPSDRSGSRSPRGAKPSQAVNRDRRYSEPGFWSAEQIAKRLWVGPEAARTIPLDLRHNQLIAAEAKPEERYYYKSEPESDRVLRALEMSYAREMIRISNLIHSKGSAAIRDFARAFRFKKEQE